MKNQDWKLKYSDLKLKFHDAVDVAFRLGMEQGLQQAQVQQSQQQAQMAAQQPGQPGEDPNAQPGEEMPGQEQSDGSELDQHIGTLESMLQKSDPTSPDAMTLKKSLEGLKAIQHSFQLAKSNKAIVQIAKNTGKPFVLGKSAQKNLPEHAKKALNMQEKIVDELMKSMADEEAKVSEAVNKTLDYEQLLKG